MMKFHIINLLLFEIWARALYEMFVYKHSETIKYVTNYKQHRVNNPESSQH